MKDQNFTRKPLAAGVAVAIAATSAPAVAQEDAIEEIVTVGIRGSLTSSMNMKRSGQGVMDGIVAEDIGKFPDTNLAESMQRITGVSIDRTSIGEGSRVTVRGVGPDFNLVMLNGRQMPGAGLEETTASNSRSFDFANLASEAVSAVEIFKTSQARLPTGGIGAVVNIKTTRPLEHSSTIFNIGAKAVSDANVVNGDDWTPEISGIFSTQMADGKFGVAITGSYQERNLSYVQAGATSGFKGFSGDEVNWGTIPQPGDPNFGLITNRPAQSDVYQVPQNMLYSFNDVQRERTNGQLTLQFAPSDAVTATLDYTYSENEGQVQRSELSAWYNFANNAPQVYSDGPLVGPELYTEDFTNGDVGTGGAEYGSKNENSSLGLNVEWFVNDQLSLELDVHDSQAESGSASPYGSHSTVGIVGFYRGLTSVDLSKDMPVLGLDLTSGQTGLNPSLAEMSGSSFRNGLTDAEIFQTRLSGHFDFDEDYSLDFGVVATDVDNRTAFANVQQNDWGAAQTDPSDFDDDSFWVDNKSPAGYFSNVSGANNPLMFPELLRWDFDEVMDAATAVRGDLFRASNDFTTDRRTSEESLAVYLQFNAFFDIGDKPAQMAFGIRYEDTEVTSDALVPTYNGVVWEGANEFAVIASGESDFTSLTGEYDYWLPSVDLNVELTDEVILRLGYSKTIGRPGWADIQGGASISELARLNGGNGSSGNPGLLPLESRNIDVSVEWYYSDSSYASLAYFNKDIDNYLTQGVIDATPFETYTPWGGARWQEAVDFLGSDQDSALIRDYIFQNYGNTPEVTVTGTDVNGLLQGTIEGIPGQDPLLSYAFTVPSNGGSETIDGFELAVQHLFGDSGFGVSANYTWVDSTSSFDDMSLDAQFELEGISDSANFIAFFENERWSAKIAYNWREEYLSGIDNNTGDNYASPYYTEDYAQVDANVSFMATDSLTFSVEGINITDEYTRVHGRNQNIAFFVTDTGPRYMIGARYTFE